MNKKHFLFILFILLVWNHNLLAQTQAEMNQTAINDLQKADIVLNKVYKQLIKTLDEPEKQLLIKAQKDWLKFRDSHCEFESAEYEGGSIQPLIHSVCLTECTKNRIDDLKASLESREK
jgi:uncharacterized protein YecT (DUF1311 family)